MIFIGNRDDRVSTKAGHTIAFTKGNESFVPPIPEVIRACMERGHLPKEENDKVEAQTIVEAPVTTPKRSRTIKA